MMRRWQGGIGGAGTVGRSGFYEDECAETVYNPFCGPYQAESAPGRCSRGVLYIE